MTITVYKLAGIYKRTLTTVEASRLTPKMVVRKNGCKELKKCQWHEYFETEAEAKAALAAYQEKQSAAKSKMAKEREAEALYSTLEELYGAYALYLAAHGRINTDDTSLGKRVQAVLARARWGKD